MRRTSSITPLAALQQYDAATLGQQAQALSYARQVLQNQFPLLTDEQWHHLLAEYKPTLWIDETTQTAVIEKGALQGFANRLYLSQQAETGDGVTLYGAEAHYVAQSLLAYVQQIKDLLAVDPQLSQSASFDQMRAILFRLSAGNSVAERICQVFTTSSR